ncbi:MAG TPA: hypothetical protein VLB82_04045 [Thermodesulfobacteriota bacterium]|nr:hypothetical protein [Thermodesulfobacteriota bacterium]
MCNINFTLLTIIIVNILAGSTTYSSSLNFHRIDELNHSVSTKHTNLISNSTGYSSGKTEYLVSQISENKNFYIELSYNSDHADVLTKDILSRALREMTTIFIGSGYTYVKKENADYLAKVYIDAEISDYKRGDSNKYDFLSKVTIKVSDKDEQVLEQTNKNVFLSGGDLHKIAVDSISKSATRAAKEIVGNLSAKKIENEDEPVVVITTSKVELVFEGSVNYKLYNAIDNLIKESLSEIKVLKRTIKYGNSLNMLVLSNLRSQQLAQLVIDRIPDKDSMEVINVSDNRVVFKLNQN